MHSLKSWLDRTGMIGYWSQGTGLVNKQMSKIIMCRRIINNLVLTSDNRGDVIWKIIRSE